MSQQEETAQRLENWILANFKNKTEFCKAAGMSLQALNVYVKGQSGIGNKFSTTLRELGCDVEWLKSGRSESPPAPLVEQKNDHGINKLAEINNNLVMIEILNRVISLENELKEIKSERNESKAIGQNVRI